LRRQKKKREGGDGDCAGRGRGQGTVRIKEKKEENDLFCKKKRKGTGPKKGWVGTSKNEPLGWEQAQTYNGSEKLKTKQRKSRGGKMTGEKKDRKGVKGKKGWVDLRRGKKNTPVKNEGAGGGKKQNPT